MPNAEGVRVESLGYKDFSSDFQAKMFDEKRFVKVQFELTYGCNLHCLHCYTDPLNKPALLKKEMPYERVIEALDKLHREGILWLCFTGGEIFMRKDFLEIYDYAYEKGFLLTLFTNGTMITEEVADHLREKPPFSIEISFHGATPETFDLITQVKGSFEKCVKGIQALLKRNLPVKLKTAAMTVNRHELEKIRAFVEGLGLRFKFSSVLYPRLDGDTSSCEYRLQPEDILELEFGEEEREGEVCGREHPSAEEVGIGVKPPRNLYRCSCGKLGAHVDPYGKVGTCTWSRKGRFDFREKSIQEGMTELAQALHSETYEEQSPCGSCTAFLHCEKIPEMSVYESGDVQSPVKHFCDVAFGRLDRIRKHWERNTRP